MASQSTGLTRSFKAAAAISAFAMVTIDSDGRAAATTTGDTIGIGVTQEDAAAAADWVAVRIFHPTFMMKASTAITAGSQVYAATLGRVGGSESGTEIGIATEAASGANDIIEIALTNN